MPDRIIRESALLSQTLDALSHGAERLFWRLTIVCDDHGRFDADPRVVLARTFPLRAGSLKESEVAGWLLEMAEAGLIQAYKSGGDGQRLYGHFPSWLRYQRRRDSRPKFPDPQDGEILDAPQFAATCRSLPRAAADRRNLPLARARSRAVSREPLDTESREPRGGQNEIAPPTAALPTPSNGHSFRTPESITAALERCPTLRIHQRLHAPAFWQSQLRAHPGVDYADQLLKAEAWIIANPTRAPKSNYAAFVHRWIGRAFSEATA